MAFESLFITTFIYLLTAVICVPIAKRLGLSSVLGYLIAGMIIGPYVLKLVGPEEGMDVLHFAEFGVVLMLFIIGLELRPARLWRLRGPILGLGGAQVLLSTAAISAVCIWLFKLPLGTSLAVGMSLALSSTAIVMQSLQEKKLTNTSGGRSAFSVLLFQDIAVIPFLALMPLMASLMPKEDAQSATETPPDTAAETQLSLYAPDAAHTGYAGGPSPDAPGNALQQWVSEQPGWLNTLLVIGAVVAIILAGRYLFQPVLNEVARTRVRETFVGLALLLVVGISLLMSSLGVSPALGAFLAGVVLADSQFRHQLEADIEPFKGLLLGVFFISVGAAVDFALIGANLGLVLGIVFGLMGLKALILWGLGFASKLKTDQRTLFSLSLCQGGEFAFVLLGFAAGEGIVGDSVKNLVIAAVAVSMALTPLLLIFEEKVLRPRFGTKEINEREHDAMDDAHAPVILAGFGRFGNYVGRMLRSQKVGVTVIDNDPDHIDFLRELGIEAYYGDASRHDLLEAAGAHDAQILIIALEDRDLSNSIRHTARQHFPHLKVMVRALDRTHQYQHLEEGVEFCVHQHRGSAIDLARAALIKLGFRSHQAHRIARMFQDYDERAVKASAEHFHDRKTYISIARQQIAEFEDLFADEKNQEEEIDETWEKEAAGTKF